MTREEGERNESYGRKKEGNHTERETGITREEKEREKEEG